MRGDSVETVFVLRVVVGGVGVVFSGWVVGDVSKLILIVACVSEAVRMVSVLPEVALEVVADGEGKAALDELDATLDGLIRGGCQQGVEMVRHDDEGVECEAGLITVPKQRVDHELRGCSALEDAVALMCADSDGEGFRINSYSWAAIRRHISGVKAQICGEDECPGQSPDLSQKQVQKADSNSNYRAMRAETDWLVE